MLTAPETLLLFTRAGLSTEATAQVRRRSPSARLGRSLGVALAGVVAGAVSILVPVVHLLSTWLLPLIGLGVAWMLYRQGDHVAAVRGSCPKCSAPLELEPGTLSDDLWLACPACSEPLRFELPPAP